MLACAVSNSLSLLLFKKCLRVQNLEINQYKSGEVTHLIQQDVVRIG